MAYQQLRQPNLSTTGVSGLCLNYARRVFGISPKYPTAWSAWNGAQFRHATRTLPNVAVPVWFEYFTRIAGIYRNWGHVAVYVPKKGVYSTTKYGVKSFPSIAALENFISGAKYVGWSEDINGVRVARPTPAPATTYLVVKGDTVTAICKKFGITLTRFKQLNPTIKDLNKIYVGQKLRIR